MYVVTQSWKLQTDELATVRLFQDNTPSVVYITDLAARYVFTTIAICFFCVAVVFVNLEWSVMAKLKA